MKYLLRDGRLELSKDLHFFALRKENPVHFVSPKVVWCCISFDLRYG